MKRKLALLLSLALLTACANNTVNSDITKEQPATEAVETVEVTTIASTTASTTAATTTSTTEEPEEIPVSEILLTPVKDIGMNTAMPIKAEGIEAIMTEADFPDKEHISRVKDYVWNDEAVREELTSWNWEYSAREYGITAPACADDLIFNSGVYADFDNDGVNESIIGLNLSYDIVYGCLAMFYCDETGIYDLGFKSNIYPSYTKITCNDYEYWRITATAGAGNHQSKVYSFRDGLPVEMFKGDGNGRIIYCYDSFLLECPKYPWNAFPAIITSDGEIKRLSVEQISEQSFNTHVNNGIELISALNNNGFVVSKIYTAGFYSFWIESDDGECCYFDFHNYVYSGKSDTVKMDSQFYGILPEINAENTIKGVDLFGSIPDSTAIEYLSQLEKCEGFADTLDMGADAVITDLDSDGSPELIIQICSMISVSDVFGIDENGAYRATVSKDSIISENTGDVSYIGEPPVCCIIDREPQFYSRYWSGGSCGGEGGWARLTLSDREIKTEPLAQYGMHREGFSQVYEYSGFENEEEYNKYIEDFFSRHESSPAVRFRFLDVEKSEYRALLLQQIEKYFTEYKSENSLASYLAAYTEKNGYPPYGVFIGDINGDGQDEMVLHINPFGNLYILYMKNGIVKVVNCEVMSQWGNTWYDSGKNRIINMYFYGHTEGTAGAYEYYAYEWNGEDYVITMHLEQEAGYYEREADGVTKTDIFIHGQSYLNSEEISTEWFEELHAELLNSMIPENRFDIIPSGAFETDEALKKEQEEQYNSYLSEKLYSPQMTYTEQERSFSDAKTLPAKPHGIRIAKIELDENGADTALDKTTESIALDCLRSSESYIKTAEALKNSYGRYYIDEVELTARTDENYQPEITIVQSYSLDLDCNRKNEHFVILRYLDLSPEFIPYETDCCVFVSDKGKAELLIEKAVFLKMCVIRGDGVQHICFEAGCNNTTSFFSIYSLKNGKPYKELEEWKTLGISDGEIKLTTQQHEYYAAYDIDKEKYVLYSLRNNNALP